jgi:phosphoribosylaminoimidazole (AIR) synthetase
MGIGMVLVVAPENAQDIQSLIAEETWVIGVLDTQVPESPQVELR